MPYKRKHSLVIFPSPKLSSIHSEATTANINIVTCRVNVFTRHEASTHDFKNYLTAQLLRLRSTHLRLLPVLGFLIIYRSCYTTRLCFLLAANSCFRFAVSLWTCLSSLIRLFFFELLCFYEAGTSRREFCDLFGDHALCIKPSVCLRSLTGLTHIFNRLGTSTLDYTVKICRFAIEQSFRSLR